KRSAHSYIHSTGNTPDPPLCHGKEEFGRGVLRRPPVACARPQRLRPPRRTCGHQDFVAGNVPWRVHQRDPNARPQPTPTTPTEPAPTPLTPLTPPWGDQPLRPANWGVTPNHSPDQTA